MKILNRSNNQLPNGLEAFFDRIYLAFLSKLKLDKNLMVEVEVLNEEEMRELNREYRGKDSPTDVLSFPLEPSSFENLLGSVYLCHSIIGDKYDDISFGFCYLFAHSLLHLAGYDHGDEMFKLQDEIVAEVWKENGA